MFTAASLSNALLISRGRNFCVTQDSFTKFLAFRPRPHPNKAGFRVGRVDTLPPAPSAQVGALKNESSSNAVIKVGARLGITPVHGIFLVLV